MKPTTTIPMVNFPKMIMKLLVIMTITHKVHKIVKMTILMVIMIIIMVNIKMAMMNKIIIAYL